jgi:hypothetical protein
MSDQTPLAPRTYILAIFLSAPLPRLWPTLGVSLKAVQTIASVMEILHVALRLVKSSLATNVAQALARHMSLWLVLDLNFSVAHSSSSAMDAVVGPQVSPILFHNHNGVSLHYFTNVFLASQWNTKEVWLAATVAAWASVEVVRYSMCVAPPSPTALL